MNEGSKPLKHNKKSWWAKRKRRLAKPREVSRRLFIVQGAGMLLAGMGLLVTRFRPSAWALEKNRQPIRPPTAALDDKAFRAACIGCGMCGTVCENGCIRYFGVDEGEWGSLTPYLDVRRRSCTLCMRCTEICPTGALTPVKRDLKIIGKEINMGLAVVDPDRCLSYLGRLCGYCHDACPMPTNAIKLIPPARPVIIPEGCVGCGRCVEMCPSTPTAIDIFRGVRT